MMEKFGIMLRQAPDPEAAAIRLERLLDIDIIRRYLDRMPEEKLRTFIHLISLSNFLYRYFCRHPEFISLINGTQVLDRQKLDLIKDVDSLRLFKYQELLKITWLDLENSFSYRVILDRLSFLADSIIIRAMQLVSDNKFLSDHGNIPFCIFGMGKLGANELNYSSDIDLIFVSKNSDEITGDEYIYQEAVVEQIRSFNNVMQQVSEDGFLYRVDLKLRPWGRSGPLSLSIDETEHYYEASSEAWERFAWLRARIVGGDKKIGMDLLERLQPFIYLRSLSSDDLKRFVRIKNDMSKKRSRKGSWNVKSGEGGIRDIEFFVQMLQIVNAHSHDVLKTTNTMILLDYLVNMGFVSREEGKEINDSYLFLRKLENRLQMIDEQQTHLLSDDPLQRIKIASSMGFGNSDEEKTLELFDEQLARHRIIAKSCFDRILPKES